MTRLPGWRTCCAIAAAAWFLAAGAGMPADTRAQIPIRFAQDAARTASAAAIVRGGTTYISAGDLARALGLRAQPDAEGVRLEISSASLTLRLTADNPFIVALDARDNANLVQLPLPIVGLGGATYVPIAAFLPILRTLSTEELSYDGAAITVGRGRPSSAFDVTGVSFEEKSNGFLIRIRCTKKIPHYESWPKLIGDNTWLYVTLADARADVEAIRRTAPQGAVQQLLVFQSPTSVQLTFKLKGQITSTEPLPAEGSNDIILAIHAPSAEQIASRKTKSYEKSLQKERDKWKLDVVVIDPGHGGTDPGTIGVGHTKEKDVTLGIGLRLGRLIEASLPDVNVVYTRKTDTFVELYRRGQIANERGGKLFVSIHCNAMPHKPNPTNGFEIYLLRPGKTENALRIAERENSVVKFEEGYEKRYQQLTEENFILLTMAQSAYVKYSEQFANILQHEMIRRSGVENNGVKQAGFYVLVGASMPNVLVETAYLSNKKDEKILRSPAGQQRLAESIFNAVKRYKLEYEKSLSEGKDMGQTTR